MSLAYPNSTSLLQLREEQAKSRGWQGITPLKHIQTPESPLCSCFSQTVAVSCNLLWHCSLAAVPDCSLAVPAESQSSQFPAPCSP